MSQASSTSRTRLTASSGPKISSLSTGESSGQVGHQRRRAEPALVGHAILGARRAASPSPRSARRAPAPRARSPAAPRWRSARPAPRRARSTAPASRSSSVSAAASCTSTRAAAEHFWPGVAEGRVDDLGHASSRSASASTITQFLPPISDTTRLTWPWPSGVSAAARRISRPTGARAGERDHVDARVADERRADLAEAGQERQRLARHARLVQGVHERAGARRRLLGRLQDRRVPGGQRGGGHPAGDRQREVPGRDHRRHAARRVAHRVALAGHLHQRAALVELDRLARVVLEEVDRLADVAVGLRPRLGALAHLERGQLEPALAQDRRGAAQHLGALGGGARAPLAEAALGRLDRRRRRRPPSARPRDATRRSGAPGSVDSSPDAAPRSPPIEDRDLERQPRVEPASASSSDSRTGARRSSRIGSLRKAHGAASSSSIGVPRCCSPRNDSFAVFSSSRRTR